MTTRPNTTIAGLLAAITLALPAADAFASSHSTATHHPRHRHHVSTHYVLGNNWTSRENATPGQTSALRYIETVVSRSL